jgi:lipopolysaccharide/colanic/teichoic acid biosynthesis glycosyltransferase
VQRFFDFVLALIALILLFPMLLITAILLRFTGEGEILFRQTRLGRKQNNFDLLKFATMLKDSPNMGTGTITIKDDPRVLPMGRFLRYTKINELPQLWNVLVGDMSLVGPRPLTRQTFSMYSLEGQSIISKVRPGLSGLGSVVFRAEEKILSDAGSGEAIYKNHVAPYKEKLELWYCSNASFSLYVRLIIMTVLVVVFSDKVNIERMLPMIPPMPEDLRRMIVT